MSWRFLAEGALPALKSRPRSRTSFAVAETHLPRAVWLSSERRRHRASSRPERRSASAACVQVRASCQEIFLSLSVLA
jgi:hypothetical protein